MVRNYFTIAVRNLLKNKAYSLINILGLSIGMACCILILLYVQYETSWDRFHKRGDQIYRVIRETKHIDGGRSLSFRTSGPLGPTLVQDFPEIEAFTRTNIWFVWSRYKDKGRDLRICLVDENFFEFFDFPMVSGDRDTALKEPFGAIISERTARYFFSDENPLGKTFTVHKADAAGTYKVTGVVQVPQNSSWQFDFLTTQKTATTRDLWDFWRPNQQWRPAETFLLIQKGADIEALEAKLPAFLTTYLPEEKLLKSAYYLEPVFDRHIYANGNSRARIQHLSQLSVAAGVILLIACVNFMNLATARSMDRSREVGVRKVLGAHRIQVAVQFISESVLISWMALVCAIVFAYMSLPTFNGLMRRELTFNLIQNKELILWLVGIVFATGILSGSYPALFLSRFRSVQVLKGMRSAETGGAGFRNGLVVFQFAISILLILCSGVVYKQMAYIQQKDLGFNEEHLVVVPVYREERANPNVKLSERYQAVKQAFLTHPNVLKASASLYVAAHLRSSLQPVRDVEDADRMIRARFQMVDESFLETLEIDLIAGRNFEGTVSEDTMDLPIIVNEATVRKFGWDNPIGKKIDVVLGKERGTVIGVMKDFHSHSLRRPIEPLILSNRRPFWDLSLRIRGENVSETIAFFEETWNQFCSVRTFRYFFLNERIAEQYLNDQRSATILNLSTAIALFVACLGLFGLAAFTAECRTKEIGIRKVLGASVMDIIALLSRTFTKPVLLANVIAWPIGYYLMQRWLENFAYRISLSLDVFVVGGLLAILIACLTVGYQALRAARANPVDSLRCE